MLLDRQDLREQAESIFKAFGEMVKSPNSSERLLCALDFYYSKPKEIALAAHQQQDLDEMVKTVYSKYLPNKVVIASTGQAGGDQEVPLVKDKIAIDGKATAYVCENYVCKAPVQEASELASLLWPTE